MTQVNKTVSGESNACTCTGVHALDMVHTASVRKK